MNKGIFITGTDTGVGKTFVAAALVACLRKAGVDAVPMKPVQTGCRRRKGTLSAPDLESILSIAGLKPSAEERAWMCPYRFPDACSPHLAARRARAAISFTRIRSCFERLCRRHEFVVVEGAGGILVPISGKKTMLDLMRLLDLPVLLVARPGLGTLNHTLLSLRELRRAGLRVGGVILNQAHPGRRGFIENDNFKTIARLGRVRNIEYLPYQS